MDSLRAELKRLLVQELDLRDRDPESIGDDVTLFGADGLGLDSLDALQIAVAIEERFGVVLPDGEEARPIFRCVATLATFVAAELERR